MKKFHKVASWIGNVMLYGILVLISCGFIGYFWESANKAPNSAVAGVHIAGMFTFLALGLGSVLQILWGDK